MQSSAQDSTSGDYAPDNIGLPPLYSHPFRAVPALRYLLFDILFPLGLIYLAMAFPIWWYLTPSLEAMTVFAPDWIALLWLRNCGLLFLFAGSLHWWLHS